MQPPQKQPKSKLLPKYPKLKEDAIDSVAEYIKRVQAYIDTRVAGEQLYVFRGEPQRYDRPCVPNLFRKGYLTENRSFERNLLDAMRQNKLTQKGDRYLEDAVVAQHGEFPSRLLDVSYNCLIALYFATTPYYHLKEDEYDQEDGMVFILFVNEVFSPSAENTNQTYETILRRDVPWFQADIFDKNHKFIDHSAQCPRIIAQQGAFILFQGDHGDELPRGDYLGIRIPGKYKKKLRQELRDFFGIHTGSVYPEITNLAAEMTEKSKWIRTEPFGLESELNCFLRRLDKELDFWLEYTLTVFKHYSGPPSKLDPAFLPAIFREVEVVIRDYRERVLRFFSQEHSFKDINMENVQERFIATYNESIESFAESLREHELDGFAAQDFLIKYRKKEPEDGESGTECTEDPADRPNDHAHAGQPRNAPR